MEQSYSVTYPLVYGSYYFLYCAKTRVCLRTFLSFHKLYMHDWKTILSNILSMFCKLFLQTKCSVSNQSGSFLLPVNRFASVSQTVKENGQAKNKWSLVSSLSPHSRQFCCIPQVLILCHIDNLFLTVSHTIKENRGAPLLQNIVFFFSLIWSHVRAVEKLGL